MASRPAVETVEAIVRKYVKALERAHIRPKCVYLFGSFAAGEAHEWSDIDVAVVSEDLVGNCMEDAVRLIKLTLDVDLRIEPHPFRPEDFTADNPWAAKIMETGIRIV